MNRGLVLLVTSVLAWHSPTTRSYEQATHAKITQFAYERSQLAPDSGGNLSSLARSLGLDNYAPLGTGKRYFETSTRFSHGIPIAHESQDYELQVLEQLRIRPEIDRVRMWLMYGAIREDDNMDEDPPTPRDIFPPLSRPLSHFYDPYYDRKLSSAFLDVLGDEISKAPDWAVGSANAFTDPNTPRNPRFNTFTLFDAREAMFRALTLQSYGEAGYVDIAGTQDPARRHELRRMYWATTFRALGDVLHVNQDMAQPQHTRNEPHAGKYCSWIPGCPGGHSSVYERYMKARALRTTSFDLEQPYSKTVHISPIPLAAGSYPIPTFGRYSDYWSTAKGAASLTGKGLANYSNQGFFTSGRNADSTEYPSPPHQISAYTVRRMPATHWDGSTVADQTPTYVYFGPVSDSWQGSVANDVPLTTFGLWDQFLEKRGALPRYTLNRVNYDAMAELLVPRAVSYSAGLINYFFRGVLTIKLPDEGVFALTDHADPKGFTKIRAKVQNLTPDFVSADGSPQAQDMNGGDLIAVIRYHKDLKYAPTLDNVVGVAPCDQSLSVIVETNPDATTDCRDGVEQIIVSPPVTSVTMAKGSEQLVEFDFSEKPVPFDVTDVVLQVVYRGAVGAETNAIAVGSVDVSEPTYFTYHTATDYVRIADRVYTRPEVEKDASLLALVQPRYCVDERVSPPILRPECLQPFPIDVTVAFDDLSDPLAVATDVPYRRFIRIAYLTIAEEDVGSTVKAVRSQRLRIQARPHVSQHKAQLQYNGTCLPHDPFDAKPRLMQVRYDTWQQYRARLSTLKPLRGVNGWTTSSCVVNGSAEVPGTPDDRWTAMKPLTPDSDEVKPIPVTIMSKYLSDAN